MFVISILMMMMMVSVPSTFFIGTIDASIPPLALRTTHNNNTLILHSDNNNDNNNSSSSIATSTVYFHQYLPNNINNDSEESVIIPTATTTTTTAKELNLNSSESRNFYNSYDPWTLDDPGNRHGYPPIPMDVVRNNPRDDDGQSDYEGDYDDDNDDIDSDDEQRQPPHDNQGDGTVTNTYNNDQNANAQKIIDEIDGDVDRQEHDGNDDGDFDIPWNNDDTTEFDQDNSASFNVPMVEALKGCKTVYKEISASLPGQSNTDGGGMGDDDFRRRRKKRSIEDGKIKNGAKRGIHHKGTRTDESRFVPINADLPRYRNNGMMMKSPAHQYHNLPFPHHHLYYNHHAPTSSSSSASASAFNGDENDGNIMTSNRRRRTPNYMDSNRVDPFFSSERRPTMNSYPVSNKYNYRHTSAADGSNVPTSIGKNGGGNGGITKRYSTRFNYFHQKPTTKKSNLDTMNHDYNTVPDPNAAQMAEFTGQNVNDFRTDAPDDPDDTDPEDLLLHNEASHDFAASSSPSKLRTRKGRHLLLADDGFGDGYDDGGDDHSGGGTNDDDYSDHDDHGQGDNSDGGSADYDGDGGQGDDYSGDYE
ncbi:uncharacterized protein LOC124498735 isoform X3 [Dermatophagoides farinae]|uniref:uncharacterized protein LOC124498735 isoform X3 n=1 Tax=Dermatophagoides farinae TaxID=6954 RepID=UPI003F5F7C56